MMADENGKDNSRTPRDYSPLRANKSTRRSEPSVDVMEREKRTSRSRSIHDTHLQRSLVEKARESRAVSFSGVSVMVDAALKLTSFAFPEQSKDEVDSAVRENNVEEIRRLLSDGSTDLQTSLMSILEMDNVTVLTKLIEDVDDVNKHFEPSGLSLLSIAVEHEALGCVGVLLKLGADPNLWDKSGKVTPMHSVAKTGQQDDMGTKTCQLLDLLVNNGGNINNGMERNGSSVLHYAVSNKNIEMVRYLLEHKVETVTRTFQETALHTAADHDSYEIAELLLEANRGCVNSLMDETKRLTPLHIVSEAGYIHTARVLLKYGADVSMLTGKNMTALHLAAMNLNLEVLKVLLEVSVKTDINLINAKDNQGRTPLFLCSSYQLKSSQGAIDCMISLINLRADLDAQNDVGNTPLHNAAIGKKPSRAKLLISSGADLSIKNNAGLSALFFINKHVPQCFKAFEERLDSGLKLEGAPELNSKVKLDFHKLSPNINSTDTRQKQDISIFLELLKSPHRALLKHPLSEAFLHLKWRQIKYMHLIIIIFSHLVYSIVYTLYALTVFGSLCRPDDYDSIIAVRCNLSTIIDCPLDNNKDQTLVIARTSWVFLLLFTLLYIGNETVKIIENPKTYFLKWDSYIDLVLILSFGLISFHVDPFGEQISMKLWQFHVAALGCFLSWLQMMFYIGKLPKFGKYVQMFRTVAYGVVEFLIAYVFLLVAFVVAFMIIFPKTEAFENPVSALVKLVVMMLGEVDYEALYYPDNQFLSNETEGNLTQIISEVEGQLFPGTAHLLVFLFIFLVSIILMNLLVGLAVSDIQGLSKSAKLEQLIQQVELINYMEKWLHSPVFSVLPDMIKRFLRHKLQGLDGLKKSLFENCKRREMKDKEASRDAAMKQMQSDIHQLMVLLQGKNSKTELEYQRSASKLSVFSNMSAISTQFQVEDDYESDVEDTTEQDSRGIRRLQSITEEAPGSSQVRRRGSAVSYNSVLTTDIESENVSDYSGINYNFV